MLDEDAQRTLAQCSLFEGTFDRVAAEAIVTLSVPGVSVEEQLWELQRKSLLTTHQSGGGTRRFTIPLTIRAFAAAQLATSDGAEAPLQRALSYFHALLEELAPQLELHRDRRAAAAHLRAARDEPRGNGRCDALLLPA